MIEIKKAVSELYLNKTTIIIEDTELNAGNVTTFYNFTGSPILFITIENNTTANFTTLHILDNNDQAITHNAPVEADGYSIAFSGKNTAQPLTTAFLFNLSGVRVEWAFSGLAAGTLTIKIYTFAI